MPDSLQKLHYGSHQSQFMLIRKPVLQPEAESLSATHGVPVVFFIHGGFWKEKWTVYTASLCELAIDITSRGMGAIELEYRRCEGDKSCYPESNEDLINAVKKLYAATSDEVGFHIDWSRVVIVGHSAGGTLALTCAFETLNDPDLNGKIQLKSVVALAPITDLELGVRMRLSDEGTAIQQYIGGTPDAKPEAYKRASPINLVSVLATMPILLVCGECDSDVPSKFCQNFRVMCVQQNVQSPVEFFEAREEDHFDVIEATSNSWQRVIAYILSTCQ